MIAGCFTDNELSYLQTLASHINNCGVISNSDNSPMSIDDMLSVLGLEDTERISFYSFIAFALSQKIMKLVHDEKTDEVRYCLLNFQNV